MARKRKDTGTGKGQPPAEPLMERSVISTRRFPIGPLQAWSSAGWRSTDTFRTSRKCLKDSWLVDQMVIDQNPSIRCVFVLYFGGLTLTEWGQTPEPVVCYLAHGGQSFWLQSMAAAMQAVQYGRVTGVREWKDGEVRLLSILPPIRAA